LAEGTRRLRTNEAADFDARCLTRADARHDTFRDIPPAPSRAAPQVPPEDAARARE
jgi:hypothetical protein